MPTSLARLLGRRRHHKGADPAFALRVAAGLVQVSTPLRVLDAACRLARRIKGCQLALVVARNGDAQAPSLEFLAGGWRRGDLRPLAEALSGRHSFLPVVAARPFWAQLADDPFQPGSALLRRFDLNWILALPFTLDLDDRSRDCVMLLAGDATSMDLHHPLVRDARLVWLTVRNHLAAAPRQGQSPGPVAAGAPWPGGDAWETAPVAAAAVGTERVVAVNRAGRELLEASVGQDGRMWEPWLLGAVQRLQATGQSREVVSASQSRKRWLEVTLGDEPTDGGPRLVGLSTAGPVQADQSEQEATMRVLGHELRTPLAAMQTSLDLVLRGDAGSLAADQQRFLATARRNLERLNRLLGDLLDAKRVEAGRLAIATETVDLGALLTAELDMLRVVCREKGIELDTSGVPASFRACVDADKVQQMLHNVVGNAIKYTGQGGVVRVRLEAQLSAAPGAGARLGQRFGLPLDVFTLVVQDSGMGMSEEFLEILFQPFRREDRAESRGLPGAGLGLHITRGLAEAHGGLVRLQSRPGEGTTVWLVLPREPGSGRVLAAGRELEALRARAATCGVTAVPVWLDVRERLQRAEPWEAASAATVARSFLAGLGRNARDPEVQRFQKSADDLCWLLTAGLWCGLVLDPGRLEAAWQVTSAAPEAPPLLAGTRWQLFDEAAVANERPERVEQPVPVA
jgi:signal transduction histidine kinase